MATNNDNNFMGSLGNAAAGGIIDIAGQGLGSIFGNANAKKSMKRQKEMANYMYDLEMRKWRETNLPAQVAMAKEAGLNPAMLYGGGGEGGQSQTTGGGQQGIMDVATQMNGLATMADVELKKATARKANAEAGVIEETGIEKGQAEIGNLLQGIENSKANEALTKTLDRIQNIEEQEKWMSQEDRMRRIEYDADTALEILEREKRENRIGEETYQDKIKIVKNEAIGGLLRNALTRETTNLTKAQIDLTNRRVKEIQERINLDNLQAKINIRNAGSTERSNEIREWEVGTNALLREAELDQREAERVTNGIINIIRLKQGN